MADTAPQTQALAQMLRHHVDVLSVEIGERAGGRGDGLDRARDYIRQAFIDAGLNVRDQAYAFQGRTVANLIATLPGAAPAGPPVIVAAHYDTVVGTPGADDNASAVAVLLELARRAAAAPPKAPVTFVAFTLEEPPVFATRDQGSRVFVRRLEESGEQVAGAIVLEMVGLTTAQQNYPFFLKWAGYPERGDFIGVIGNSASRPLGEKVLSGMRLNPRLPVASLFVWLNGWLLPDTRLSDHASFWDAGIPALMITDTAYFRNPNYHGPFDTADSLDYAFMAELVQSLELALGQLP